jgi:drug/metabolite transporter (DMT)-like permease
MSEKSPTTDERAARDARDRMRAILLMCLAVALFSCLDTAAKVLTTHMDVSVTVAVWARFIVQFLGLLLLVPALGVMPPKALFHTNGLGLQLVRSTLMMATTAFNFLALQTLRLDQTITIVFLAPLVVALLAGPLLGEWVGWRRMLAILVGFLGVVIAVRPDAAGLDIGIVYSLLAMLAYALFMLLTRHMAPLDPPIVTLFYSMFVGTAALTPFALLNFTPPAGPYGWLLLASMGLLGGLGHWLFLHAYRLAPASSVAPFLYTQILSMVALGYLVFADLPDAWTITGAAIVAASGVYLLHRERVTRSHSAPQQPPTG